MLPKNVIRFICVANDFLGRDDKLLSVSDISEEIDDIGKVPVNADYNEVYSGNIHLKAFF